MFGISIGELLLVLIVVFLISPKELPIFMRKIGRAIGAIEKVRDDLFSIKKEFEDVVTDDFRDFDNKKDTEDAKTRKDS